jgi:uncharacterized OB-fold protein
MPKHYSTLKHNVWLPYRFALGPNFHRWFEGLKEEKIWGNRCPRCNNVLVPARSFCPGCGVDMGDWVEVSQEGQIVSWVAVKKGFYGAPGDPPYICALIRLDGTDCDFLHLVGGVDIGGASEREAGINRGTRVRAVWDKEKRGRMLDLRYFEPVD